MNSHIKRGEIYYANLDPVVGSEQGGVRPVVIIQNDVGNMYSSTTMVAAITSSKTKHNIPTHIEIYSSDCLPKKSLVLMEQIRTIDKTRLTEKIGQLSGEELAALENALRISFGIT